MALVIAGAVISLSLNVLNVIVCIRYLLQAKEKAPVAHPTPDLEPSDRESEIVPLVVDGLSNEDIASRLFISRQLRIMLPAYFGGKSFLDYRTRLM